MNKTMGHYEPVVMFCHMVVVRVLWSLETLVPCWGGHWGKVRGREVLGRLSGEIVTYKVSTEK